MRVQQEDELHGLGRTCKDKAHHKEAGFMTHGREMHGHKFPKSFRHEDHKGNTWDGDGGLLAQSADTPTSAI